MDILLQGQSSWEQLQLLQREALYLCVQFWRAEHDKRLLYGVLKHGWAQWQVILKDSLLGIEPVLRKELRLSQHQQHLPSQADLTPAAGQTPAANQGNTSGDAVHQPAQHALVGSLPAESKPDGGGNGTAGPQQAAASAAVKVQLAVDDSGTVQLHIQSPPASKEPAVDSSSQQQDLPAVSSGLAVEDVKSLAADQTETMEIDSKLSDATVAKADSVKPEASSCQAQAVVRSAEAAAKPDSTTQADTVAAVSPTVQPEPQTQPKQAAESVAVKTEDDAAEPESKPVSVLQNNEAQTQQTKAAGVVAVKTEHDTAQAEAEPASTLPNSDAAPSTSASVVASGSKPAPQAAFGCPKCRWSPKGCAVCRARADKDSNPSPGSSTAATAAGSPTTAAGQISAERATLYKMNSWLMSRTTGLCHALKQAHQGTPTPQQPVQQPRSITINPVNARLVAQGPSSSGLTHTVALSQAAPGTKITSGAPPVAAMATAAAGGAGQWQQQAVQLSQVNQQQRMLQHKQQLAEAQKQQQRMLILQQQQRQQHTSFLRQQHQTAQLQQQRAQAVQLQQQRMRQQQQQQGLQQRQLDQQRQQLLQQQLAQQQQQLNAQRQVQFAMPRQSSGQQLGQQPRSAAVFASAAQHAQYHQQQQQQQMHPSSSGAYISHPLSRPLSCPGIVQLVPCSSIAAIRQLAISYSQKQHSSSCSALRHETKRSCSLHLVCHCPARLQANCMRVVL